MYYAAAILVISIAAAHDDNAALCEEVSNELLTRSRKCKNLCRLFAQKACICNLKAKTITAEDVTVLGTLIVDGVRIPTPDPIQSRIFSDTTNSPNFDCLTFQKSRAGAAVQDGDTIGCINFQGFDGATFSTGATIEAQVDGAPSVGDMPGRILFLTSPDGTATPVERLRIDNAGLATFANSIDLPNTISAAVGMFSKAGVRFLHNFGTDNTFLGVAAGNLTLAGNQSVGIGTNALSSLTSGSRSVAIGFNALTSLQSGVANTAVGNRASEARTSGSFTTAVGDGALLVNVSDSENSAFGSGTLASLTSGSANTSVGSIALGGLISGSSNTAVGRFAGLSVGSSGASSSNVIVGENATTNAGGGAFVTVTQIDNSTYVGAESGATIATGLSNTVAVGYRAQVGTSQGTAVGALAQATGSITTAVGVSSVASGLESVALGRIAQASADGATALGSRADATASLATAIGFTSSAAFSDSTALGAVASTIQNGHIQLGINAATITLLRCFVALTVVSDERTKRNIQECSLGLAFINAIKPLKYKKCGRKEDGDLSVQGITEYGFSAQQVKQAAEECGAEFDGVQYSESEDLWMLRYNDLLAPMIKAIQELSQRVEVLEAENHALKAMHE